MAKWTLDLLHEGVMHDHSESDLGAVLDPRYLKLNQTTPQTITASPIISSLTGSKVVFTTSDKILTSTGIGTSAQFIKGDGSLDSSTYLTSFTEADTLATVTGRGATTSTVSTFSTAIKTPKIYPSADSTTAVQILKADGVTSVLNVDTTNARVGIGTTSPTNLLHVAGGIYGGDPILTAGTWNGIARISGGEVNLEIGRAATSPYGVWLQIRSTAGSAAYPLVLQPIDGNVGIGTTSPSQKLEVNGVTLLDDKLAFTQTDLNEYIDSLNDGYIDYRATTGHRFGDGTNQLVIDADGDLSLEGTAKYERHIQIDAKADGTVGNQPTQVDFFTAGGLQYPTTGAKYAFCQWEVPDDWDGTNVYFEVDWFPDSGATSGTDAVRWTVEYRAIAEGELISNGTSVTVDNGTGGDTADYSQYQTKHTRFTIAFNNANQPLTKQDHVYFKISRDTSVTNDFSGSVTVSAYEIIYTSTGFPTSN